MEVLKVKNGLCLAKQGANIAYCTKRGQITDELVHILFCCARRSRRRWASGGLNLLSMKFKGLMQV